MFSFGKSSSDEYDSLSSFFKGFLSFVTVILGLLFGYAALYVVLKEDVLYGTNFFSLYLLFSLCFLSGKVCSRINTPPLFGMLVMGIILGNIPNVKLTSQIEASWSSGFRSVALAVILIRGGMSLKVEKLFLLKRLALCLSIFPCVLESLVVGLLSYFLLRLPWSWSFMLGFLLSAVSTAVIVPLLILTQREGLGTRKGIPTLIMASASVDNVICIIVYTLIINVVFIPSPNVVFLVFQAPLEVVLGCAYAFLIGALLWYFPHPKSKHVNLLRFFFLLSSSIFCIFGSSMINFGGAGALGCIILSIVAFYGWRKQGWLHETPLTNPFTITWNVFEPMLFGLIGSDINLLHLNNVIVLWALLVIVIGVLIRSSVTFLAVSHAGFTAREKAFVALAWIPKATVQAAYAPLAMEMTLRYKMGGEDESAYKYYSELVLIVAVLAIILTAPTGAFAISHFRRACLSEKNSHVVVTSVFG